MEFLPPNSKEAEQAVLGSMLIDEKAAMDSFEALEPHDFYSSANQVLFETMKDLFAKGSALDLVTLVDKLETAGALDGVGGTNYVTSLSLAVPSTANCAHYIKIVKDKSVLRSLAKIGGQISKEASNEEKPVDGVLDDAEQAIFNVAMGKDAQKLEHIENALLASYEQIVSAQARKGELLGISSGFKELDRKTSGFQPSQLIVVAGRPGMGKTSLALNFAANAAVRNKTHVAIFSLEMSREQLVKRLICSEAQIDLKKATDGTLEDGEYAKIGEAIRVLSNAPIFIDDTAGVSVMSIRSKCRRMKMRDGLGMIVIDYLQLMQGSSGRSENRQLEISEMTRSLKNMARELDVPIILLSQLSRGPEARQDHRPMLSDLRESGSIEQDADNVFLLYREKVYNEEADDLTEIIVAKQRSGPTGKVEVAWVGEWTKFMCLDNTRSENK